MQDSKLGVLGISLATSLIEEVNRKAFDAASAEDALNNLGDLTLPISLGPALGETPDLFNDFDDYSGQIIPETTNTIVGQEYKEFLKRMFVANLKINEKIINGSF